MLEIQPYRESDQGAGVALWRESGLVRPWNDPVKVKDIPPQVARPTRLVPDGNVRWPVGSDGAVDDVVCMGKRLIPD